MDEVLAEGADVNQDVMLLKEAEEYFNTVDGEPKGARE